MHPPVSFDVLRPGRGPVRFARAVGVGLICVAAAFTGHAFAEGAVSPGPVAALFVLTTAVTWLLASRRLSTSQLLGLLVLCQALAHVTAMSNSPMDAQMVGGHAMATVICLVVLRRGEAFLWFLAQRLGLRASPVMDRGTVLPSCPQWRPVAGFWFPTFLCWATPRWERGPPVGTQLTVRS